MHIPLLQVRKLKAREVEKRGNSHIPSSVSEPRSSWGLSPQCTLWIAVQCGVWNRRVSAPLGELAAGREKIHPKGLHT